MKKVAVILPPIEQFNPFFGGAITRVVENQFSSKSFDSMYIKIFGRCSDSNSRVRTSRPYWYFQLLFKLNYLLRKIRLNHWCWCIGIAPFIAKYDCIFIENRPQFAIIFRKLFPNKKIYLRFHSDFSTWGASNIKKFYEAADIIIYCSEDAKRLNERLFNPQKNIGHVVYNGSSVKRFYPCAKKKENQILFVGRIMPIKGVLLLLDTFHELLNTFSNLKLVVVGSTAWGGTTEIDHYEAEVNSRIDEINALYPDSIIKKGYLDNSELPKLYSESTFLCMPSLCNEAFGLVAAEAMLSGTVVIGSKNGGIKEIVGNAGITVFPSVETLVPCFVDLIEHPERRREMEKEAAIRAKAKFSWEVSSSALYKCITEAQLE